MISVVKSERVPLDQLKCHPRNPRDGNVADIVSSIQEHGQYRSIVANRRTGHVLAGNHTFQALQQLNEPDVLVDWVDVSPRAEIKIVLRDNRSSDRSGYHVQELANLLSEIRDDPTDDLEGTGFTDEDLDQLLADIAQGSAGGSEETAGAKDERGPTLGERFGVPPFSVLDARQGYWQERKREWLSLGFRGDAGRGDSLIYNANPGDPSKVIIERVVSIPEGTPLFDEVRAYMRERLKATGITQAAVNKAVGVVGMAGHWFGKSQPTTPTPELWEKLKPVLGLDDRYDEVMQSITRAGTDGAETSKFIASIVKRPGASSVDSNPLAQRGRGDMMAQVMGGKLRRSTVDTHPAGRGGGGMNDQTLKANGRKRADGPRTVRPGGPGANAPTRAFGGKYAGGDAWRGHGPKPPTDDQIPRTRMTWAAGNKPPEEMDDTSRRNAAAGRGGEETTGTSMFDPVLCELIVRWFSPKDGHVLDPFAGGCTLGVVAAYMGRRYTGSEFRAEQIAANLEQVARVKFPGELPRYVLGDSRSMRERITEQVDLVFTDPPYWNLEKYSDREGDGSNKRTLPEFLEFYGAVLREACALLKDDRFFVVKVGDIRHRGLLVNLVGETIRLCLEAGLRLYNEAILVTAVGSLPVRAGRVFATARKLGKTHQNVLVFVKGDPKRAVAACGQVEIPDDLLVVDDPDELAATEAEPGADTGQPANPLETIQ